MVVLVDRLRQGLGPVVQVLHRVAGGRHHCFTALNNQPRITPPIADLTIYLLISEKVRKEKTQEMLTFFWSLIFLLRRSELKGRALSSLVSTRLTQLTGAAGWSS